MEYLNFEKFHDLTYEEKLEYLKMYRDYLEHLYDKEKQQNDQ